MRWPNVVQIITGIIIFCTAVMLMMCLSAKMGWASVGLIFAGIIESIIFVRVEEYEKECIRDDYNLLRQCIEGKIKPPASVDTYPNTERLYYVENIQNKTCGSCKNSCTNGYQDRKEGKIYHIECTARASYGNPQR